MDQYLNLLQKALQGERRTEERTETGTIGGFGAHCEYDLSERFPAPTVRPIAWKGLLGETLTFLHGETNVRDFLKRKSKFWTGDAMRVNYQPILDSGLMTADEISSAKQSVERAKQIMQGPGILDRKCKDANELLQKAFELTTRYENQILMSEDFAQKAGDLGPVYGAIWRGKYPGAKIDQIAEIEKDLRNRGNSRRNIFSGWHPDFLKQQALAPCHMMAQIGVRPESKKLDLEMYQRSADCILGVIHNIPQYALIAQIFAHTHGYNLGTVGLGFGDYHVYLPHVPIAEDLLTRPEKTNSARLEIKVKKDSVSQYEPEDFELVGYKPHPALPYKIPMFGGLF
jgi:thymidylate synthase